MLMNAVDSYLSLRRAAGFELGVPEYLLRSFARYANDIDEVHVKSRTAIEWATRAPSISQRDHRLGVVRRFALHMQAEDRRHEMPPRGVFGRRKQRTPPFIYSKENIESLIRAASQLSPTGSLRPQTYATLIALLVITGLRISEALALRFADVTPDGLTIRQTKFKKSRLVPLHESAICGLERYLMLRKRVPAQSDHVFIGSNGHVLSRYMVHWTFGNLLKRVGLTSSPSGRRPRIHDLRHTMAVRALESCPEGRDNVGRHMLALSTYLGHAHVSDTYWYLESTPELMQDVACACETFFRGGTW